MPGYKQTLKDYKPQVFISFDGEAVDENTKWLTSVPPIILDETDNRNDGVLTDSGNDEYKGYRAAMPSLVKLESNTRSFSFAYKGRQPNSPNVWEKTIIEIPHSDTLNLEKNNGAFTLIFNYRKDDDRENGWRNEDITNRSTLSIIRPIIRKAGVFTMHIAYIYGMHTYIEAEFPDNKKLRYTMPDSRDWHDREHHIVLRWRPFVSDTNEKKCEARIYVDAVMVAEGIYDYYADYPTTTFPSSIFIGAFPEAQPHAQDRATSNTQFDNIVLYNEAFDDVRLARLFKKIYTYQEMITSSRPEIYFPMQDANDPNVNTLEHFGTAGSSMVMTMRGDLLKYAREDLGPDAIPASKSVAVSDGGQITIHRSYSDMASVLNISRDYSLEFWFKAGRSDKSVLFSSSGSVAPYTGLTILINAHNHEYRYGAIQVQEFEDQWISAEGTYSDGKWHHLAVRKSNNTLELFMDGIKVAGAQVLKKNSSNPGMLQFFGIMPGRNACTGSLCHIAMYQDKVLSDGQIIARANYYKIYRVLGQVTLRGEAYKANVRVYSNLTGKLKTEVFSDMNTGNYSMKLADAWPVDIVCMNSQDPDVKYRVVGPITPSEYTDPNYD